VIRQPASICLNDPCVYRKPYPDLSNDRIGEMIALICFVVAVLASPFKSKVRLKAENAVFRHQLIVLSRRLHGRVRLTNNDRLYLTRTRCANPVGTHHQGRGHPPRRMGPGVRRDDSRGLFKRNARASGPGLATTARPVDQAAGL
jgi:hypothetical protein